jgi:hypothetical protein
MTAHLIVLTGPKKCREDVSAAEDIIAIAHDDDLQLIEGVVCPSQMLELIPEVNRSAPP